MMTSEAKNISVVESKLQDNKMRAPMKWEDSLRGASILDEERKDGSEIGSVMLGDRLRRGSISSTASSRLASRRPRECKACFGIRLNENGETARPHQGLTASVRVVGARKLEYMEIDNSSRTSCKLTLQPNAAFGVGNDHGKKLYQHCVEPTVLQCTAPSGKSASILTMDWDSYEVVHVCQTLFDAIQVYDSLSKEFYKETDPRLEASICISWVHIDSEGLIRDILSDITRRKEQAVPSPRRKSQHQPRFVEHPKVHIEPLLEVRLTSLKDVSSLVDRITKEEESLSGKFHRVVNVSLTCRDEQQDSTSIRRIQLVFANPTEPKQIGCLMEVFDAIELQKPRIPYHASKVGMAIRDALHDRENLVVVGAIDVGKQQDQNVAENENDGSLVVCDPDASVCTLSILSRVQEVCGIRFGEEDDDEEEDDEEEGFEHDQGYDELSDIISEHFDEERKRDHIVSSEGEEEEIVPPNATSSSSSTTTTLLSDEEFLKQAREQYGGVAYALKKFEDQDEELVNDITGWFRSQLLKVETLAEENKSLRNNAEFLNSENITLVKENETIQTHLDQLTQENLSHQKELEELRQRLGQRELELAQERQRALEEEEEEEELDEDSLSKEELVALLKTKLRKARREIEDFSLYKEVMETTVVRLQNEMGAVMDERNAVKTEAEKALAKARKSRKTAFEETRNVKELSERMTKMHHEHQITNLELDNLREVHQAMVSRARRDRKDAESAKKMIKQLESQVKDLNAQVEEANAIAKARFDKEKAVLTKKLEDANLLVHNLLQGEKTEQPMDTNTSSGRDHDDTNLKNVLEKLKEKKRAIQKSSSEPIPSMESFTQHLLEGLKARRMQRRAQSEVKVSPPRPVPTPISVQQAEADYYQQQQEHEEDERQQKVQRSFQVPVNLSSPKSGSVSTMMKRRASSPSARSRSSSSASSVRSRSKPYKLQHRPQWGAGPGKRLLHSMNHV